MSKPRLLGVLLCYNDGDILADAIEALLQNGHDVIAWNHGSTDETAAVLDRYKGQLLEVSQVSRDVDFYDIYPMMSRHLLRRYVDRYDWISWPDQDEILEGPTREKPYGEALEEVIDSPHSWIQFNDFLFWHTAQDSQHIASPCARVRHYSFAKHGMPKIRSWRAAATNMRWFNHNRTEGSQYPVMFNLRHYPMRSTAQMQRRLNTDRSGLRRGPLNSHYENMSARLPALEITPDDLRYDDGVAELDAAMRFDWRQVYGRAPEMPRSESERRVLSTQRWYIADEIRRSFGLLDADSTGSLSTQRLRTWRRAVEAPLQTPILVFFATEQARIVTEVAIADGADGAAGGEGAGSACQLDVLADGLRLRITADASTRALIVAREGDVAGRVDDWPIVALVRGDVREPPRLASFVAGEAEFHDLTGACYYLMCEPSDDRAGVESREFWRHVVARAAAH